MAKDNQWVVIITNILGKTSFPGYSTRLIHPTSLFELRRDKSDFALRATTGQVRLRSFELRRDKKDGVDFAMLFTLRERPEDIRSSVVKGSR